MTVALRWWRVPVVAVLVAGAVLLALESHALSVARAANDHDAVQSLLVVSGEAAHSSAETISARERALLGLDGMPELRSAVDSLAARRAAKGRAAATRAEHEAERTLDGVLHSHTPARTRSQAANLLGVLLVRDSMMSGTSDGIARGTRLFRQAVELAPDNASAKFNLELLLSLPGNKGKSKSAKTAGGGSGAGADEPGSGY